MKMPLVGLSVDGQGQGKIQLLEAKSTEIS